MATILSVTKDDLRTEMLKYARDFSMTENDINNIVERLSLHSLMCVVTAFRYHYLLCRLIDKYKSVRKLIFKIAENE